MGLYGTGLVETGLNGNGIEWGNRFGRNGIEWDGLGLNGTGWDRAERDWTERNGAGRDRMERNRIGRNAPRHGGSIIPSNTRHPFKWVDVEVQ